MYSCKCISLCVYSFPECERRRDAFVWLLMAHHSDYFCDQLLRVHVIHFCSFLHHSLTYMYDPPPPLPLWQVIGRRPNGARGPSSCPTARPLRDWLRPRLALVQELPGVALRPRRGAEIPGGPTPTLRFHTISL